MEKIYKKIINILESRTFFWVVVALFVAQATWLAVSASYPMIYDEYYHSGFIDIYSKHILPFINSQTPEQTVIYGDITRVPSYLFHYLLSFPYRIVGFFTDSFYIKIVSLRLINVAFVALGLIFFRKLLLQARLKKSIIHVALFCVVMLPIFPYVAAHVNYDNLLFLLTPIFLIFGLQNLRSKKPDATALISFVSVGLPA